MTTRELTRLTVVYLETAITSDGPEGIPIKVSDLSLEFQAAQRRDVKVFMSAADEIFKANPASEANDWPEGYDGECLVTDFWLDRNDHGCGFWDRTCLNYKSARGDEDVSDILTRIAQAFEPVDLAPLYECMPTRD